MEDRPRDPRPIEANTNGAAHFGVRSTTELEFLDEASAGDLAFWTGWQCTEVEVEGQMQRLTPRITEVFRRVDGAGRAPVSFATLDERPGRARPPYPPRSRRLRLSPPVP